MSAAGRPCGGLRARRRGRRESVWTWEGASDVKRPQEIRTCRGVHHASHPHILFQRIARKSMRRYCCKDVITDPLLLGMIHHGTRADVKIRCRRSRQADCKGADVYFRRGCLLRTFVGRLDHDDLEADGWDTSYYSRGWLVAIRGKTGSPEKVYPATIRSSCVDGLQPRTILATAQKSCSMATRKRPYPGMISTDTCSQVNTAMG